MKTVSVQVQGDHLERLAQSHSPIEAVTELVWNCLDADATEVSVRLVQNALGKLEEIHISDNGHGLPYEKAEVAFESLGGSWKKQAARSAGGRLLHGRLGKGRFRAFALGEKVTWTTRFEQDGKVSKYTISGRRSNLRTFEIGDTAPVDGGSPGTEVVIATLYKNFTSLAGDGAIEAVTECFALYLRQYPNVRIVYDGTPIDPALAEELVTDYVLDSVAVEDGRLIQANLTIIEWKTAQHRALFLCNAAGFALAGVSPGIQAPGFTFTSYLKADYLQELEAVNALGLEDLHPDLKKLLDPAKEQMRKHFRARAAERTMTLVEEWKSEAVYPYSGQPRNPLEAVERQVFDVVALNVHEYLPSFEAANPQAKRLAFRLLRQALESSPSALQRIIRDVLDLPKEKQAELAELLERTTLEAIISAAKVVADRLDFLRGLETLVFDPQSKEQLLERRQLHRIVAEQTWVFGEQFNLTVDDESLTTVLKRHVEALGIDLADTAPVLREDGSEGVVDLMLSRRVPLPNATEREHLVVELKRPSVKIDDKAVSQVESYAFAVADDERFKDTTTRWVFWAVSNDITDSVRKRARQAKRPEGLLFDDADGRIFIWVKTWGQILQDCRGRLQFFEEQLQYRPNAESALEYLRKTHERYLPKALKAAG